jgi:hypothetical protein
MCQTRKRADKYFHAPPENLNCAQAILKAFSTEFNISAQEIANYQIHGGGRAPGGICGALFAVQQLLGETKAEELATEFQQEFGTLDCLELKQLNIPCADFVAFADRQVEHWLNKK